jgi:subtilisin family serine protease
MNDVVGVYSTLPPLLARFPPSYLDYRHLGQAGYNRGGTTAGGDEDGNYTNSFGGTSSATPGAAGVAALVLARNKNLRADEVKDILKRACDQIDTANGHYDGTTGHSEWYGFGRLNAVKAVKLAALGADRSQGHGQRTRQAGQGRQGAKSRQQTEGNQEEGGDPT